MCSPIAAQGAILGVNTAAQFLNARETYEFQKDSAKDARRQITANAVRQYAALQNRQIQETARATQAIQANAQAARLATGAAVTSAAEGGAAGNAAAALIGDFERKALGYESAVIRNKAFLDAEFKEQAESVRLGAEADLNRAYAQVQKPNYLEILLGAAGGALQIGLNNQSPIVTPTAPGTPGVEDFFPGTLTPQGSDLASSPYVDYSTPTGGFA